MDLIQERKSSKIKLLFASAEIFPLSWRHMLNLRLAPRCSVHWFYSSGSVIDIVSNVGVKQGPGGEIIF